MTESSSSPDPDEAILIQFQKEFEAAADKAAVVERFCALSPHLAPRIRARAALVPLLGRSEAECEEALPERFGEFRVVRRIGGGGMGQVYEARHERLNRRVAVKTIRPDRASPVAADRFRREQRALARLHQTHIVSIFEAGEEGPVHYFAMPYIDGAPLSSVVRTALHLETSVPHSQTPSLGKLARQLAADQERAAGDSTNGASSGLPVAAAAPPVLPPEAGGARLALSAEYFRSVAEAMADAAEALQHTHDAGLLHRDVKPSNLMVDRHGHCWVIDLGLAGLLAGQDGERGAATDPVLSAEPVTATGVLGTPQYMAPEQWAREKGADRLEVRTDVYGLGVTLYELLTLRRAFDGETHDAVCAKILAEEPTPPRALVGNVPPDLAAVCRKAMQKERQARYATAQEFADDLRRWLRHEPTKARGAWVGRRLLLWGRRNPGWAAAILLAVLAAVTLTQMSVYAAERDKDDAEKEAKAAQERARDQEYQVNLLELQRTRFGLPITWSKKRLELVRDHYQDRPESAKRKGRDEAAATLTGLDAESFKVLKSDAGSLVFNGDGKRLLLGGVGPVKGSVWDRTTDRTTPSEQAGGGPVAFSADGTPLQLVATDACTVRLWDVDRQRKVREFTLDPRLPRAPLDEDNKPALALSADGTFVAASTKLPGGKGVLVVWEATGKEVARSADRVEVMAFSPDKALLASGDGTGTITVRPVSQIDKGTTLWAGRMGIHCLAFTRDPVRPEKAAGDAGGWLLAAGEAGGGITIWDVDRKMPRTQCLGSHHAVSGVAFSPDGTLLASVGRGAPRLWDVATGRLLLTLNELGSNFTDVAFSPDGRFLAVSALGIFGRGGVDVYALDYGRGVATLRGLRGQVVHLAFSPDDRYLAALTHDWQVGVWDFKTGQILNVFEAPIGPWSDNAALAFSADGRLACASWQGAVLWDVVKGREVRRWVGLPPGLVNHLAFRTGDKLLLFREESEDKQRPPLGSVPRVCRIRDLLAKDPTEPLVVLRDLDLHVFGATCPTDGSFFVVDGVRGPRDKREVHLIAYDGLSDKPLWDQKYDGGKGTGGVNPRLDPTGKLLIYQLPGQEKSTVAEMPAGKTRSLNPHGVAFGPGADWWLLSPPGDSSGQHFGLQLYRRGEDGPLVTLGADTLTFGEPQFNAAGTHAAWGNADGTVTVCEIQEVRRRLAAVGLGW